MAKQNRNSKSGEVARATAFIGGLDKHLASVSSITFASAQHVPTELKKSFQALIDFRTAVLGARATLKAKLSDEASGAPAIVILLDDFEAFVKLTFSEQPEILADFGLAPKKARKPLTAEQLAARKLKAEATRKARGTQGPVARKGKKGNVSGVVLTPVITVTQPASPSARVIPRRR